MSTTYLIFTILLGLVYLGHSALKHGDLVGATIYVACCAALGALYSQVTP